MLVKIPAVCSLSPLSLFLWQPDKLWSIAGISLHVTKDSCGLLSISPLSLSSYGSLISCDLLQGFLYMLVKISSVCSLSPLSLFLWQPDKLWSIAGISLHVTKDSCGLLSLSPLSLSSYGSLISCDLLLGFLYMLLKIPVVCSLSPLSLSSYGSLISCDLLLGFLYMLVKIPLVCSLSPLSLFLWQPDKLWSIAGISLHVTKDSLWFALSLSPLSLSSYGSLISCDLLQGFLYMLLKIPLVCSLSLSSISLFLWQPDKLWSIAGISLHVTKDSCGLLSLSPLSLSSYNSLISCDLLLGFLYMLLKIPVVCSLSPLSLFLWQPDKLWSIAGISLHVTKDSFGLLSFSLLYLSLPMTAW